MYEIFIYKEKCKKTEKNTRLDILLCFLFFAYNARTFGTVLIGVAFDSAFFIQNEMPYESIMRSLANAPPLAWPNFSSRSLTCRFFFSSPRTS